ncbi:MAG: type 4a pilus biogenesis protein PilO [Gemmatimonadota bacterium]
MAELNSAQNRQKVMLGVLLVGALGYVGYAYAYQPRAEEIASLETRLSGLQLENQTARILTEQDGEDEIERQLARYREQLAQVEALIPSSEELPDLLDAISTEAQRTGVEIALIQPVGATADDYYTRRTYDLAVQGEYHAIGDFLTRIGSLPRIVTPTGLDLTVREEETRTGNPELEARFSVETYILPLTTAEVTSEID